MKKISIWFGIPVCILILVGIGFFTYSAINPSRETVIREFLTILHTCPNQTVMDVLANQKDEYEIIPALYSKYFTDSYIDELKTDFRHDLTNYQCSINQLCDELGYEVKIDKIIISHTYANEENEYRTKVNILYGKKGTLEKATLDNHMTEKAIIYFDKTGNTNKIEKIQLYVDLDYQLYKIQRKLQESKDN